MKARLLERYRKELIPALVSKFGYKNTAQAPRILKIVINMGLGEESKDEAVLKQAMDELALIVGQRPVITRARKAISNFKIRRGVPVGCKVTLRGNRMYEFIDRLINVALPRIRDFKGLPAASFDGRGGYTLGLNEQTIFPEIDIDKVKRVQGMDITITTSARSKEETRELLRLFGAPFSKETK